MQKVRMVSRRESNFPLAMATYVLGQPSVQKLSSIAEALTQSQIPPRIAVISPPALQSLDVDCKEFNLRDPWQVRLHFRPQDLWLVTNQICSYQAPFGESGRLALFYGLPLYDDIQFSFSVSQSELVIGRRESILYKAPQRVGAAHSSCR